MPLLFSYGTLQEDNVQLSTFGRLLQGQRDELPGFEPSLVKIEDPEVVAISGKTHHANATFNGRQDSRVSGTVFDITDAELAAADQYERLAAYKRILVKLASGKQAWVSWTPGLRPAPRDFARRVKPHVSNFLISHEETPVNNPRELAQGASVKNRRELA
jgi:hypothetical protein